MQKIPFILIILALVLAACTPPTLVPTTEPGPPKEVTPLPDQPTEPSTIPTFP